ncbi:hypothetical protein KC321_g52 [Hortaea werneckii]|nr:hypothetical protein KC321_g52 [Hortaea werneckii]
MLAENSPRSSEIHCARCDSGDDLVTIVCTTTHLRPCRTGAKIRTQPSLRLRSYNKPAPVLYSVTAFEQSDCANFYCKELPRSCSRSSVLRRPFKTRSNVLPRLSDCIT